MTQAVRNLQIMLRTISDGDSRVLPLIPDGIYGANTHASVRSFQEAFGLPVTGEADYATWTAVATAYTRILPEWSMPVTKPIWFPGQTIQPGDYSDHLHLAQAMLVVLSKYYGELSPPQVTGTLDAKTEAGLKWVQRAAGLEENGALNTRTWHVLNDLYRITAEKMHNA